MKKTMINSTEIKKYIEYQYSDNEPKVTVLMALLRDAREVAGRNANNGEMDKDEPVSAIFGTLAYLVVLEHIGKCFTDSEHFIESALGFYDEGVIGVETIEKDQKAALYTLRCAFAHGDVFFNIKGKDKRNGQKTHTFEFWPKGLKLLVVLLEKQKEEGKYTQVDLGKLSAVVECIYTRLVRLAEDSKLKCYVDLNEYWFRNPNKEIYKTVS